jgi:hypothetical protein
MFRVAVMLIIFILPASIAEAEWPLISKPAGCDFSTIEDYVEEGEKNMQRASNSESVDACTYNSRSAYKYFSDAEREAEKCTCRSSIKNSLIRMIDSYLNDAAAATNSFRLENCAGYSEISIWDFYDLIRECKKDAIRERDSSEG